jgi:hypothetical protein
MKKLAIKVWEKSDCNKGALPITRKELIDIGVPESDIDAGCSQGDLKTFGPWQLPISYQAIVISKEYTPEASRRFTAETEMALMFGYRKMRNIRQSGYEIEGWLSIGGKRVSGFSASQLLELEDGKLINIATIHARIRKEL